MNFKEIETFNKLSHSYCLDISMHLFLLCPQEKKNPSIKKKKRFLDPTSNILNQNRVKEQCYNLHITRHRRGFLHASKCENYCIVGNSAKLEKHILSD